MGTSTEGGHRLRTISVLAIISIIVVSVFLFINPPQISSHAVGTCLFANGIQLQCSKPQNLAGVWGNNPLLTKAVLSFGNRTLYDPTKGINAPMNITVYLASSGFLQSRSAVGRLQWLGKNAFVSYSDSGSTATAAIGGIKFAAADVYNFVRGGTTSTSALLEIGVLTIGLGGNAISQIFQKNNLVGIGVPAAGVVTADYIFTSQDTQANQTGTVRTITQTSTVTSTSTATQTTFVTTSLYLTSTVLSSITSTYTATSYLTSTATVTATTTIGPQIIAWREVLFFQQPSGASCVAAVFNDQASAIIAAQQFVPGSQIGSSVCGVTGTLQQVIIYALMRDGTLQQVWASATPNVTTTVTSTSTVTSTTVSTLTTSNAVTSYKIGLYLQGGGSCFVGSYADQGTAIQAAQSLFVPGYNAGNGCSVSGTIQQTVVYAVMRDGTLIQVWTSASPAQTTTVTSVSTVTSGATSYITSYVTSTVNAGITTTFTTTTFTTILPPPSVTNYITAPNPTKVLMWPDPYNNFQTDLWITWDPSITAAYKGQQWTVSILYGTATSTANLMNFHANCLDSPCMTLRHGISGLAMPNVQVTPGSLYLVQITVGPAVILNQYVTASTPPLMKDSYGNLIAQPAIENSFFYTSPLNSIYYP